MKGPFARLAFKNMASQAESFSVCSKERGHFREKQPFFPLRERKFASGSAFASGNAKKPSKIRCLAFGRKCGRKPDANALRPRNSGTKWQHCGKTTMRGIECAFWATIGQDIELKTSKAGKPYVSFSAVVTMGQGEDVSQWPRVGCFGEVAEKLAAQARKGDRIYCEGALTLNTWESPAGETKQGLNVAAWKCERLSNIGRNRATYAPDEDKPLLPIALPAHKRKRPAFGIFRKKTKVATQESADKAQDSSENERPFDDAIPF
jgi:single-strand DNA-binding protein